MNRTSSSTSLLARPIPTQSVPVVVAIVACAAAWQTQFAEVSALARLLVVGPIGVLFWPLIVWHLLPSGAGGSADTSDSILDEYSPRADTYGPTMNTDGTPLLPGGCVDVMGKAYGTSDD